MKVVQQNDVGATIEGSASIEGPGTRIGRYELLELIGEGGMGLVYLAEQKEPVKRRVALKIIKPGMDSKQVVARFEAERQVLALLDHPNIAHVFDAGCTETGRPYFVMEHVKGLSITQYCDQHKLNIEQRLKLFRQVCEGVHHAHQKGIIHRDLKPSNILVSVHEDRVVPKIIDFGIAKATTQPLTDKTVFTYQGQLLGTPEYMSPEQVDLATQDIDIRSDIYSLGVVLYELLAGVLPFERESLARLGFAEVQRTIREQEPASPSTRLSSLGEQARAIAESRCTQVVPLARRLHRELEWIPLKAMRKDRCRRYRSAAELADDVQNYLDGNPLTAGPETAIYRVKKFVRRHAGSVATAALIAVTILLGLAISTAMYLRAEKMRVQAEQARQKETSARAQAEQATKKEAAARTEAEQAKEKETVARTQAEQAEQATKQKAEELRRTLYVNSIQLADAKHREGNAKQVRSLLDSCPEDLRGWEWNRLNYIQDQSIRTTRVNHGGLIEACFSPDGRRIITAGNDNTIKVWDSATGEELKTLRGHKDGIDALTISSDGKRIVSGSVDGIIKLWDAESGFEMMTLQHPQCAVSALTFSPDGAHIVSGTTDGTIKVWDAQSGADVATLRGHQDWVNSVAFSPDGRRIVSSHEDNTVRVWDAETGLELLTMLGAHKEHSFGSAVFSSDGSRIVADNTDGTIKVWDAKTGDTLTNIAGHEGVVSSVTFSPDGQLIASGGYDNMVRIWDAETGEELKTFQGHNWLVVYLAFSPDGKHLMSASADDTIKLWDVMIDRESTKVHGHFYDVRSIAFSPDGRQIVSCSGDSIKLWDAYTGETMRTIAGHAHFPRSVAFSPNGMSIASGDGETGAVRLWDASSGAGSMVLRGHKGRIWCTVFSPDGKYLASSSSDKTVKLWDVANGSEIVTFRGHKDIVRSAAFSPDGKHIISGSYDKTIRLWDVVSGSEVMVIQCQKDYTALYAPLVCFSPDGKRILSAVGKEIKIWDALTGADLMTIEGHGDYVTSVAFSPDGKRIISGSRDRTAKLWDSATGSELVTLHARPGVTSAAFSPDGMTIATGTYGGNLFLWQSATSPDDYERLKTAESARRLIEKLYRKRGSYHDVLSELQNDATLDSAIRQVALRIANTCTWDDVYKLQYEAWVGSLPDKDVEAYQAALEKVEKANAWEPNDPAILNTLGAAQYRLAFYEDALKTLAKSAQILSDAGEEPNPANVAFTAMTLHRIGRAEEAKAALEQLRELCKDEQFAKDTDVQELLVEAEGLIEGKKP
jgi:WD40 repeat protein/tRNA A-37 threonylcarbamoyl transferase component Bud32